MKYDELIWTYLDGECTPFQAAEVEQLLKADPLFNARYLELVLLHREIQTLGPEEPSMSFTRNVMDQVAGEPLPRALETRINRWIVFAIGGFFGVSLLALLVFAVINSSPSVTATQVGTQISESAEKLWTPSALQIVIGLDILLGLLFLDYWLRRKKEKAPQAS